MATAQTHKGKALEYRAMATYTANIDESEGIVEAIVNVFGVVDGAMSIIQNGAFAKTINENGRRFKVLNSHNGWDVLSVVGVPLEVREIGRDDLPEAILAQYPEATGGLWTRTKYLLDTPEGAGVFARIKAGAVNEYSIGFKAIKAEYRDMMIDGQEMAVRVIKEIALWEYSPVIWGSNPATGTVDVRGEDMPLTPNPSPTAQSDAHRPTGGRGEREDENQVGLPVAEPSTPEAGAEAEHQPEADADAGALTQEQDRLREAVLKRILLGQVELGQMRDDT